MSVEFCSHLLVCSEPPLPPKSPAAEIPSGRFTTIDSFAYSVHLGDSSAAEKRSAAGAYVAGGGH